MLQENHFFKITLEMRSWGWWGSAWFRETKTTTESLWLMLHVPTYAIQTTNGGMQKFLIISKKRCAWVAYVHICAYVCLRGRHQNPPESSFFFQAFLVRFQPLQSTSVIAAQGSMVRGNVLICLIHLYWNWLILLIILIFFIQCTDNWEKFWTQKISILLQPKHYLKMFLSGKS